MEAIIAGYVSPALEVTNGTKVKWGSLDTTHSEWEMPPVGGPATSCFRVTSTTSSDSKTVTFEIQGSALNATVDGVSSTCLSAQPLPSGGFAVPYYCAIHPNMRGLVIVSA